MSKKVIWTTVIIVAVLAVAAVGVVFYINANKVENVEGTLEEIMTKVYAGISEENLPMMLGNMPVDSESAEYYLGTSEVAFKEALVSESMVGAIAHSVVLVRLNDANDADAAVETIKASADPRKWVCVEASNVVVESKGDLVILIMSNETLAPTLETNFNNL